MSKYVSSYNGRLENVNFIILINSYLLHQFLYNNKYINEYSFFVWIVSSNNFTGIKVNLQSELLTSKQLNTSYI